MVSHEYSRILGKTMKFGFSHHLIRELQWREHEINDSLANGGEITKMYEFGIFTHFNWKNTVAQH